MPKVVYRQNGMRVIALLFYFGFPLLMIGSAALQNDLKSGELWLAVGGWLLLWLAPLIWTLKTRLELSNEGLTLCEGVFTLHAPWKDIRALDLTPGAQGAVLHRPLPDKPARRLRRWALANQISPTGALKGGVQRHRWIDEGLFVPLQAFSKVVCSSQFHQQLREHVPDLQLLSPEDIAVEEEKSDRVRNIWTFQ